MLFRSSGDRCPGLLPAADDAHDLVLRSFRQGIAVDQPVRALRRHPQDQMAHIAKKRHLEIVDRGIVPVEKPAVLRVQPFSEMGTPTELIGRFGDRDGYTQALRELEAELYRVKRGAA